MLITELERIKESYKQQQEFLKNVSEEQRRNLLQKSREEYEILKNNLLNNVKDEFMKLINNQQSNAEILRYLEFQPQKKNMYVELINLKKKVVVPAKKQKPHKDMKFEEDQKEIFRQLNENGVSTQDLFIWTENIIYKNKMFLVPGDFVRLRSNMKVTIQGTILCITGAQLKIKTKEGDLIFSKDDFDNGCLSFVGPYDVQ